MTKTQAEKIVFRSIPIVVLAGLMILGIACQQSGIDQQVVVRVGDERLTVDELIDEIPAGVRSQVTREDLQDFVARWINSQILYQEAKRRQIDSQLDVQRELRKLEVDLIANALLDLELDKPIDISDKEISDYYSTNRNLFQRTSMEILVLHAQFAEPVRADSLCKLLNVGGDFIQAAKKLADQASDTSTWESYLTEDETSTDIAAQVFRLPVGTISRPIQSDFGYHVFKIMNRFPKDSIRELSQVRSQIIAKLEVEKRQARYRQLLSDLKSNTIVETNLALLDNVPLDSLLTQRTSK